MRCDFETEIGGSVHTPHVLLELVDAIVAVRPAAGPDVDLDAPENVLEAIGASTGGPLTIRNRDVSVGHLDAFLAFCRMEGYPYRVRMTQEAVDESLHIVWLPGMDHPESESPYDGDETITIRELDEAIAHGMDAVVALRESRRSFPDVEMDLSVLPFVLDETREILRSRLATPLPNGP